MSSIQNSRQRNKGRQHNTSSRGGYQNANNYKKDIPEPENPSGVYSDHRTAVMMCSVIGKQASVKTANGKSYHGRITGFSDKGDIALADAKLEEENGIRGPHVSGLVIPKDAFVVCKTNGVDLKGFCSSSDFTDSAIASRSNGSAEGHLKELEPWLDDDAGEPTHELTLDNNTHGWDSNAMFEENREKFNLKSSFNDNMHEYTTRLPQPGSEAYEAKERFAKAKADEIEGDATYQRRIAKENSEQDEDTRFSFVHREESSSQSNSPHRVNESGVRVLPPLQSSRQSYPPLQGNRDRERDRDEHLRNGNMSRGGPSRLQRQNSPYSSSGGQQGHSHHHNVHNNRQPVNNHYHQGPPPPSSSNPMNRNQTAPNHLRQQGPPPPHSSSQPPPNHHPASQYPSQQNSTLPSSQQRIPPHQQMVSPTQPPSGGKSLNNLPQSSSSSSHTAVPSSPSLSSSPPSPAISGASQVQHSNQQKTNSQCDVQVPRSVQSPSQSGIGITNVNSPNRHPPAHMNGESGQSRSPSVEQLKSLPPTSTGSNHHQHSSVPPPQQFSSSSLPSSSNTSSHPEPASQQHMPSISSSGPATSQAARLSPPTPTSIAPAAQPSLQSSTPDVAKSKIADLQDFKEKFVLEPPKQEENVEVSGSTSSQSVQQLPVSSSPAEVVTMSPGTEIINEEKKDDKLSSKLNPNAPEFTPKAPVPQAQSPSPQPRSSPHVHQVVQYPGHSPMLVQLPQPGYAVMHQNPSRGKRATVSLQANVDHLTHQVTGQPLLATQGPPMPPMNMMYIQGAPGAALPAGYQAHFLHNPQLMGRMPNTLSMTQSQQIGLDQSGIQSQPQAMFVPTPQQQPIPAHLPHPQPAHAASAMQPQPAQPAHVPNPAPSPVHQPPPQSVTPQPAHYINFGQHNAAMPRTSISQGGMTGGQQNMPAGSITYMSGAGPQYTSYHQSVANGAQYATTAQPQTSQNSNHSQGGPQPQYVMMPHATPQGHPPMQQHSAAQAYQFHTQHNIIQGPPQMPPNHGANPNQSTPHLLQHNMQASIHQQIPGSQPGVYMSMPSTQQLFQHQQ